MKTIATIAQRTTDLVFGKLFPTWWKGRQELKYWRVRQAHEGVLRNAHYAEAFTQPWGLVPADYDGKRVLDIGCGPRGSLEWAGQAALRIGLDPLAARYLVLGTGKHDMQYVAAGAEELPFRTAAFDIVSMFNSLDHVADVDAAIADAVRVTRPGGLLLVIVDVNHPPTATEPHDLTPDIVQRFSPACELLDLRVLAPLPTGAYDSIRAGLDLPEPATTLERGWLVAKLQRI